MPPARVLQLSIEQLGPSRLVVLGPEEDSRHVWELRISLAGVAPYSEETVAHETQVVIDPFDSRDHDEVAWYLNDSLAALIFNSERAETPARMLDDYRHQLFESLEIDSALQEAEYDAIEIHIYDSYNARLAPGADVDSSSGSIHSLYWEHLEEPSLWITPQSQSIKSVTVRRSVGVKPPENHGPLRRTHHLPQFSADTKRTFNILLVVARRGVHEDVKRDIISPATVQCAILQLEYELLRRGDQFRIHLEVVRPGTLQELEDHLQQRENDKGPRFFDIVHFDLHGGIKRDGKAILEFNEYTHRTKLITRHEEAQTIANLLKAHRVDCVVLGACKSAQADLDVHANLSWALVANGISHVLAMSFNMPDSMSEKFFKCFYRQLFIAGEEFTHAASSARRQLSLHPDRFHYASGTAKQIQDWFVPVVYSNGTRLKPHGPRSEVRSPGVAAELYNQIVARDTLFRLAICICLILYQIRSFHSWDTLKPASVLLKMCYLSLSPLGFSIEGFVHFRDRQDLLKRLDSKTLVGNMLRVESDLKMFGVVFCHSADDPKLSLTPFIHSLAEIWQRTQFVHRRVIIRAEWFLETDLESPLWHGIRWLLDNDCHNIRSPYAEEQREARPRSVVVIENFHILFLEPAKLTQDISDARRRMLEWLTKTIETKEGLATPYLVISGKGKKYWNKNNIGIYPSLWEAAMTEVTGKSIASHV